MLLELLARAIHDDTEPVGRDCMLYRCKHTESTTGGSNSSLAGGGPAEDSLDTLADSLPHLGSPVVDSRRRTLQAKRQQSVSQGT